ncbi:MFS transporter [Paenibacillus sp. OV219]|uniref:MFS transporter n=1 Tax=Paenibacillus sp. OV219 TaxID=1884377 RepID=UPI0008AF9AC4|nr:MFS transporter [Paenibacillus sp. OV219]SEM63562.1 Major Facilitator Superfamily protein [Paenibacillus sp. OV219]
MKSINRVLRQNIKNNLYNGIAWSIGFNFVTPFIPILAARLGASNNDYALLSSVPAILTILLTFPASMLIGRYRQQKRIISGMILLSRFSYLLLFFLPYWHVSPMVALIALVSAYSATNTIIAVSYQSIMGEIIPSSYRNKVFAQRNLWIGITGMVTALVAGYGIDHFAYPYGFQAAVVLGFIASLIETWYFHKLRIPSEEEAVAEVNGEIMATNQPSEAEARTAVIKQRSRLSFNPVQAYRKMFEVGGGWPFILFCGCATFYTFSWMAAWPMYSKLKADILHATNTQISITTVVGSIGSLLAFGLWAKLADRRGNGFTVFVSSLALGLAPFWWAYAPSMNYVYVYDFIGGFVTSGFQQSIFNRLLEIVPEETRHPAISLYTTLSQISAIFAPLVGMSLFTWIDYVPSMILIGIIRVVGALCFLFILLPKREKRVTRSLN